MNNYELELKYWKASNEEYLNVLFINFEDKPNQSMIHISFVLDLIVYYVLAFVLNIKAEIITPLTKM